MSKRKKLLSYFLKLIVIVAATVGIWKTAEMCGDCAFMYFTIQSNILIAIICAIGAFLLHSNKSISNAWFIFKFVGTVAITLTGVVFCFVLAPNGSDVWILANFLTHVLVPLTAIADFFLTATQSEISKKSVLWVTVPPTIYAIYAGIGYIQNWAFDGGLNYPYFFLNWGSPAGALGFTKGVPYMGTVWWILALLIFLILVGFLYLAILKRLRKI
ncbi:MAG: Pr6Pr family membrane protein [Paludibacteraceae bacterium]|nr:Pr6Pr family membrane protein [Paludibacteraceae bacterium]